MQSNPLCETIDLVPPIIIIGAHCQMVFTKDKDIVLTSFKLGDEHFWVECHFS
ncbi:MAG: hypothetical protein HQL53_07760 [Magnetococcales bacterium]|nr:hypothetical protein [Magnetococcales bacterium]